MGYEVLDSTGSSAPAPESSRRRDIQVTDLADLPPPDDATPRPSRLPDVRTAGRVLAALASSATTRRRVARLVLVTLCAGAVGALVGGVLVRRDDERRHLLITRATFAASAVLSGVDRDATTGMTSITAHLHNSGPLPVHVVIGADRLQPGTTVEVLSATPVLKAGETRLVRLAVPVSCDDPTVAEVSVPVRTADGRRHEVVLLFDQVGGRSLSQIPCNRSSEQLLSVEVAGTVTRPVVRLRNTGDVALRVDMDDRAGMLQGDPNRPVDPVTSPALPVTVPAHGTLDLRLTMRVRHCPTGGQPLEGQTYFALIGRGGDIGSSTGFDAATQIGAALALGCG